LVETGADVASVNALERVDNSCLVSANQLGQLKVWDLRCGLQKPQQRLLRKFPEVHLRCRTGRWDLFAVTETWLTTDILDSELRLPGMELLRRDRPTRGGVVLLYYHNRLQFEQIECPFAASDALWCKVKLTQHEIGLIRVVYRPPSSADSSNETLLQTMSYFLSLNFTHVLVMDDFNCPKLSNVTTLCTPFERQLKQFIQSHPLYNHVKEPTSALHAAVGSEVHVYDIPVTIRRPIADLRGLRLS
uniref:WD_REPEATS_REGION domain-containing protein n=1 Tax=Echinostoma caproni TaxID=27848 RepID=A0A183AMX6_9TREM